jgi:hypothetical protein
MQIPRYFALFGLVHFLVPRPSPSFHNLLCILLVDQAPPPHRKKTKLFLDKMSFASLKMGNSIIQMTIPMAVESGSPFPLWCHLERDVLQQLLCIIIEAESTSHQSQHRTPKAATPPSNKLLQALKP